MSWRPIHELHRRRLGRNLGVGLALGAFVVIVFGLSIAKTQRGEIQRPGVAVSQGGMGN
ncbi:hypothetical protein [Pseudodonghicola xiamenensis]|uniref:Cytochrome C oxidase assembly protein n=1 Tax=Pseudodonghicola xiamenensis TaxID=337702 RepID=A0A8J3H6Y1_9RHOB|nr:hypothetical protein [Pseudodonghicola xiamenensis]GHG94358.1 hypothetical protein GCM10010961_27430 [Pseudodonghicola xiamenensis]